MRMMLGLVAAGMLACMAGCDKAGETAAEAKAKETPLYVLGKISECDKFANLNPHFPKAFEFLKRTDLATLKPGRHEIDGDNCYAMVMDVTLTPLKGHKVEAHRQYIDVQAPVTGPETIGVLKLDEKQLALPFDAKDDYVLFDAECQPLTLKPGDFVALFAPLCGHAPSCIAEGSPEKIRKVVVKVKAE